MLDSKTPNNQSVIQRLEEAYVDVYTHFSKLEINDDDKDLYYNEVLLLCKILQTKAIRDDEIIRRVTERRNRNAE